MTAERLEQIKDKIEDAKVKRSKAEGAMEKIEATWAEDFGVNTLAAAEAKLQELDEGLSKGEARLKELGEQLEAVTDWDEA